MRVKLGRQWARLQRSVTQSRLGSDNIARGTFSRIDAADSIEKSSCSDRPSIEKRFCCRLIMLALPLPSCSVCAMNEQRHGNTKYEGPRTTFIFHNHHAKGKRQTHGWKINCNSKVGRRTHRNTAMRRMQAALVASDSICML